MSLTVRKSSECSLEDDNTFTTWIYVTRTECCCVQAPLCGRHPFCGGHAPRGEVDWAGLADSPAHVFYWTPARNDPWPRQVRQVKTGRKGIETQRATGAAGCSVRGTAGQPTRHPPTTVGQSYHTDGRPLHLILNWVVGDACQINCHKIIY